MVSYLVVTENDALRLPDCKPVHRLIPLLRWHISNLLNHLKIERSRGSGLATDPREAPRKEAQEDMFWELVQEDVKGKPPDLRLRLCRV